MKLIAILLSLGFVLCEVPKPANAQGAFIFSKPRQIDPDWAEYNELSLGIKLSYPASYFFPVEIYQGSFAAQFIGIDGAKLTVFVIDNIKNLSLSEFRESYRTAAEYSSIEWEEEWDEEIPFYFGIRGLRGGGQSTVRVWLSRDGTRFAVLNIWIPTKNPALSLEEEVGRIYSSFQFEE